MNIYHIEFTDHDWDEYDSFVVIAENEDNAIKLIKDDIPEDEEVDTISCIGVSNRSEEEVVLGSFNRG